MSVVAGGWSVQHAWLTRLPGHVLAVNDAGVWAPSDEIVSMDRLWAENRWTWLKAHAPTKVWLRASTLKNIPDRPEWLIPFANDHLAADFCEEPAGAAMLNGTNSGLCALNRAYQLRPRKVIMWGFDMNRSPKGRAYFFPDYEWAKPGGATSGGKYAAWAAEFAIAARQFAAAGMEVVNASPTSAITAFEKIKPEELLT